MGIPRTWSLFEAYHDPPDALGAAAEAWLRIWLTAATYGTLAPGPKKENKKINPRKWLKQEKQWTKTIKNILKFYRLNKIL